MSITVPATEFGVICYMVSDNITLTVPLPVSYGRSWGRTGCPIDAADSPPRPGLAKGVAPGIRHLLNQETLPAGGEAGRWQNSRRHFLLGTLVLVSLFLRNGPPSFSWARGHPEERNTTSGLL